MSVTIERRQSVTPPKQPLRSYSALATAFNIGLAGGIWALTRSRKLPERIAPQDLILLGITTFELSRIVTRGKITSFLRRPFAAYEGPADVPAEEEDAPIGKGPRRAVGELLTCPYCLGTWIAAGLTLGYAVAPQQVRMIGSVFTVKALADGLNTVYAQAWASDENR